MGTGTIPGSQFPTHKITLVTLSTAHIQHKYRTSAAGLIPNWFSHKLIKHHNFYITTCFFFAVHMMGDVKLVTSTRVSKTSLTLSPPVPTEAPAFTLPPRNIRAQLGATARFEGKVRNTPWRVLRWVLPFPEPDKGTAKVMKLPLQYGTFSQEGQAGEAGRTTTGLFLCRESVAKPEHCEV